MAITIDPQERELRALARRNARQIVRRQGTS